MKLNKKVYTKFLLSITWQALSIFIELSAYYVSGAILRKVQEPIYLIFPIIQDRQYPYHHHCHL